MLGIRAKIVLPFTALFLVTLLAVAFLAARATALNVDARIQAQMTDLAVVLSQAGFAGNPTVLGKVKTIVGGELATVNARGSVLATTLDRHDAAALGRHLVAEPPVVRAGVAPTRLVALGHRVYRATFAPVHAAPWREGQVFLYLLAPEADIRAATRAATRPILAAAACGAVAVVAIGFLVGHVIARPVQTLAAQARRLADGDASARLTVRTGDEVGELADAFNALLESLRQAEARVIATERLAAVGQVVAGIAHEVRNPLAGIKMSAQLLGRKLRERGAPDDESVAVMLAEVARLEVIADDLLTFAGSAQLAREPADLNVVIREVLFFMARQLTHAGVAARSDLFEPLPEVRLDPRRVRQVVLNLVLNAIEAMPNGGVLTVRTRATPEAVVAEADDTGHGIAAEIAPRIFEPFFTTKRGGSGLGLGVSRMIAEAHGGTLTFKPLEKGTRFVLTIPRG